MILVKHRTNSVHDLLHVDPDWGVEIDLRSCSRCPSQLKVAHDPYVDGENFDSWLHAFTSQRFKGPLILNTKEDQLEEIALKALERFEVKNFFFLDTTLPTLVKWTIERKQKFFAVRFSTFEPIEFVLKFEGLCDWIWLDCFQLKLPPLFDIQKISEKFKICLVSPELQCKDATIEKSFIDASCYADAICTKNPKSWIIALK